LWKGRRVNRGERPDTVIQNYDPCCKRGGGEKKKGPKGRGKKKSHLGRPKKDGDAGNEKKGGCLKEEGGQKSVGKKRDSTNTGWEKKDLRRPNVEGENPVGGNTSHQNGKDFREEEKEKGGGWP